MPSPSNRIRLLQRTPRRLSITVSDGLFRQLQELADEQGRSTSNLCAFLLERGAEGMKEAAARSAARP